MRTIENKSFDEERALYHLCDAEVIACEFAGEADGESALKEIRNVTVRKSLFSLRYPLWHAKDFRLLVCTIDEFARAPIWYAKRGMIEGCSIEGIKCLRECEDVRVKNCEIASPEFGWKCDGVVIEDTRVVSEYFLLDSKNIELNHVEMEGKYSFQYIENMRISHSKLDTKDAFWHSKNVVVEDSVVKGEYLGWYSDHLTLINCTIIGTQPLCYCSNLELINCTMKETDLAFEYSDVKAEIVGHVDSIKNPMSGRIVVDSVGEMIVDSDFVPVNGDVVIRDQKVKGLCNENL